ncbi:MAG: hypothetical protein HYT63_00170 [Candidatus Yanofskybacteria bacterium]|nr:hypothetical protein [Candidatus Yanofskybacteria bacterium]
MTRNEKLKVKEIQGNFTANKNLLNFCLLLSLATLVIWYAFWLNFLASGQYKANLLEVKLIDLTKRNNELISEKSEEVKLSSLLIFASQFSLVEQKNIEYIFDRKDVAQVEKSLR